MVGGVPGETVQLNVIDGDRVPRFFVVGQGSEFNVEAGADIGFGLQVQSGSELNFNGGDTSITRVPSGAVANFNDGEHTFVEGTGGEINVSGGVFDGSIGFFGGVANISGGDFTALSQFQLARNNSVVNISGGNFGSSFNAVDAPFGDFNLTGTEFQLNGEPLDLVPGEAFTVRDRGSNTVLSGVLADGSPFNFTLNTQRLFRNGDFVDRFGFGVTVTVTQVGDAVDPNFVEAAVNDFGSGFQVSYDYTVTEDTILDDDLHAWIFDSGYSGSGTLVNAFVNGFNGPTSTTSSFAITNADAGFQPELQIGDTISFTVQVDGASYSADDFSPTFLDIDPPPVVIPASAIDISTNTVSQWNEGFTQSVNISNLSQDTTDGWSVILDVPDGVDFTLGSVWNADAEVLANGDILFTSKDYNSAIGPNGTVNFGFNAAKSSSVDVNLVDEFFSWV